MTEKTEAYLRTIMSQFVLNNVKDPETFEAELIKYNSRKDGEMEGYSKEEMGAQRELSIKFAWGHNHDFGTFVMDGILKDRHIEILAAFIDKLELPSNLVGKRVLDIGVWCGGTSLLLAGMGAEVDAIEEVVKYGECAWFLFTQFEKLFIKKPEIIIRSFYDLSNDMVREHYGLQEYDYVIFPGVLYHLTDPIVALRILFNSLKDGGELYLETAIATHHSGQELVYQGPQKTGNNWFSPSISALFRMTQDVGFEDIIGTGFTEGRYIMKAVRKEWKPMMKAGLSRKVR